MGCGASVQLSESPPKAVDFLAQKRSVARLRRELLQIWVVWGHIWRTFGLFWGSTARSLVNVKLRQAEK